MGLRIVDYCSRSTIDFRLFYRIPLNLSCYRNLGVKPNICNPVKERLPKPWLVADVPGVEPGIQESKSCVLPLHYTSILHSRWGYAHQEVVLITRNYTTFYTLRPEFIPMSCCCRGSSTCLCCVPTMGSRADLHCQQATLAGAIGEERPLFLRELP